MLRERVKRSTTSVAMEPRAADVLMGWHVLGASLKVVREELAKAIVIIDRTK